MSIIATSKFTVGAVLTKHDLRVPKVTVGAVFPFGDYLECRKLTPGILTTYPDGLVTTKVGAYILTVPGALDNQLDIAKATSYAATFPKSHTHVAKATAYAFLRYSDWEPGGIAIPKATVAASIAKSRTVIETVKATVYGAIFYDFPYMRIAKATAYAAIVDPTFTGNVYQDEEAKRPTYQSGTTLPFVTLGEGQSLKTWVTTPGEYLFFLMKPDTEIIEYTETLDGGEVTLNIPDEFNQLVAVYNVNLFEWQKQAIRNEMIRRANV